MAKNILHAGFIHVDDLPPGTDLVGLIRSLNDSGLQVPWMWALTAGSRKIDDPDGFFLNVGVNGEIGALSWATNTHSLVPGNGSNEDDVMYRLAGLHESYMPPGAEVSIDTVYEAVSEFLLTRQLPTCVEWRPANRFDQRSDD